MFLNQKTRESDKSCGVCRGKTIFYDRAAVLRYSADYYVCLNCGTVAIPNAFWLKEAHSQAISNLDTGIVNRNITFAKFMLTFLTLEKLKHEKFLDWGGGPGLLTRIMRDFGFDCWNFDKYSEHPFDGYFHIKNDSYLNFNVVFALESFEHLENPLDSLFELLNNVNYFIFTTEILEDSCGKPSERKWWYFMPESGQHVTFVTRDGIKKFSKEIGMNHLTSFGNIHIASRNKLKFRTEFLIKSRITRFVISNSLFILSLRGNKYILQDNKFIRTQLGF